MKKAHWNVITPQNISATSFWANCREFELASNDIMTGLIGKFSLKPAKKVLKMKKEVCLRIINKKSAQNLLILLHSSLKNHSVEKIKQSILRCDTTILSSDIIEQLLRCLPPSDQITRLREIQNTGESLSESEKYLAELGEIKDLEVRLKSINFKLCIEDMIRNVKDRVSSGIKACEEIKSSQKFAQVLELVLLFGNIMNFDSNNGQAYGFELPFLTRLKDTKDSNNQQTLLHFLVETIENKIPESLSFGEELAHSKEASRINVVNIQENMTEMHSSLENIKSLLNNSKESQTPDDIFTDSMVDFSVHSSSRVARLERMIQRMENCFREVAEHFTFNALTYSIEMLFSDIEIFKDSFAQAYKDILNVREKQNGKGRMSLACTTHKQPSHNLQGVHKQEPISVRNDQAGIQSNVLAKANQVDSKYENGFHKCRLLDIKLSKLTNEGNSSKNPHNFFCVTINKANEYRLSYF